MYSLKVVGECDPDKTGTKVTFLPDGEIFEETVFEYDVLKQRLREMAFLTKGLKIILQDLREEEIREHTFHYEGGIKEFVNFSFVVDLNFKPYRECVYNGRTYSVQTSGYFVSSSAEFSAGVKNRKYNLYRRNPCLVV